MPIVAARNTNKNQEDLKMKRTVLTIISCILTLSLLAAQTVFADNVPSNEYAVRIEHVRLDDILNDLSETDISDYQSFGDNLANLLRNADNTYDKEDILESFFQTHHNPVYEYVLDYLSDYKDADIIELEQSQSTRARFFKIFEVDDNTLLVITPTYFCIDKLIKENERQEGLLRTSSTSGACSKTYYGLSENKLFSLTVECSFYYDGSSAWYKNGYSRYYSPGNLSVWQVSNWTGGRSASGTSYNAYCSGQFRWGFNYGDIGLIVQTYNCYNNLSCDKYGNLYRDYVNY